MLNLKQLSLNGVIRRSINTGLLLFLFFLSDVKLGSLPDVPVPRVALVFSAHGVFGELGMLVPSVWSTFMPDSLTCWS